MESLVGKVKRVQTTKTSRIRYDIECVKSWSKKILTALSAAKDLSQCNLWHAKRDVKYARRTRGVPQLQVGGPTVRITVACASLNVAGLTTKATAVSALALQAGVKVMFLQETLRDADAWPCHIPGYFIVGEQPACGTGKRGVLVAVREGTIAVPMEPSCAFIQWAQVFLMGKSWLMGSLYLPTRKDKVRRRAVTEVKKAISAMLAKFVDCPLLIGGDFNCSAEGVTALLKGWNLGLTALKCMGPGGSNLTWHRIVKGKVQCSDIDHFIANDTAHAAILSKSGFVDRTWAISDHWPVGVELQGLQGSMESLEEREKDDRLRLDPYMVREAGHAIAWHSTFEDVATIMATRLSTIEGEGKERREATVSVIDDMVESLHIRCRDVAEELHLTRDTTPYKKAGFFAPRQMLKHLKVKGVAALRCAQLTVKLTKSWDQNTAECALMREELRAQMLIRKREATVIRQLLRIQLLKRTQKCIAEGTSRYLQGVVRDDTSATPLKKRLFWEWLRKVAGGKSSSSKKNYTCPVVGDDGELKSTPSAIRGAWLEHFEKLAKDTLGLGNGATEWEQRLGAKPDLSTLPGLNDRLTWAEVQKVIWLLANWKAPGLSGIIPEWFKYSIGQEESGEGVTPSPLQQVVLTLLQLMFENEYLAKPLQAAVLVTVPKKGDLSDRNNHRGISLIETLAKILLTIVARRINVGLEVTERIVKAQAGFRRGEEVVSQFVVLHELCTRRQRAKLTTVLAFLDFEKAYDSVPQGACLLKERRIGIQGCALGLLTSSYENATCMVMGNSDACFALKRGMRQGAPSSPDEFNILINDFLDGQEGVNLPYTAMPVMIPGLLVADDSLLVAKSVADLEVALKRAESWAQIHNLRFGLKKCGIMMIGPAIQTEANVKTLERAKIMLQGAPIPVVTSYTYLGGVFQSDLSFEGVIADRCRKAQGSISTIMPVITNASVPLAMRRLTLLTFIQPTLTYLGEVIGMRSKKLTAPLQKVMDNALRKVARGYGPCSIKPSLSAVMVELGLPHIHACIAGLRARAFVKYRSSKTYVANLYGGAQRQAGGWVENARKWLVKNAPPVEVFNVMGKAYLKAKRLAGFASHSEVPARMLARKVKWTTAEKTWATCPDKSYRHYAHFSFRLTSSYIQHTAEYAAFTRGFNRIFQIRCGSFLSGGRAGRRGVIDSMYTQKCVVCGKAVAGGESINHMILSCSVWSAERQLLLRPLYTVVREYSIAYATPARQVTRNEIVALFLGGMVIDEDTGDSTTLGSLWSSGAFDVDGNRVSAPLCLWLAKFLTAIDKRRERILKKAMREDGKTTEGLAADENDPLTEELEEGQSVTETPAALILGPSLDILLEEETYVQPPLDLLLESDENEVESDILLS